MSASEIQCPHCGVCCEIAMTHGVDIVVLSCPSCSTPLVFYHGQTFAIDAAELRYLKSQGHVREAEGWIRPSAQRAAPSEVLPEPEAQGAPQVAPAMPAATRERHQVIDDDAILNLRIDLERCESVDDFLKLLG